MSWKLFSKSKTENHPKPKECKPMKQLSIALNYKAIKKISFFLLTHNETI